MPDDDMVDGLATRLANVCDTFSVSDWDLVLSALKSNVSTPPHAGTTSNSFSSALPNGVIHHPANESGPTSLTSTALGILTRLAQNAEVKKSHTSSFTGADLKLIEQESIIEDLGTRLSKAQGETLEAKAQVQTLESTVTYLNQQVLECTNQVAEARCDAAKQGTLLSQAVAQVSALTVANQKLMAIPAARDSLAAAALDETARLSAHAENLRSQLESLRGSQAQLLSSNETLKFDHEKLVQRLEIANSQVIWFEKEHKTAVAEALKMASEKSAQIVQLTVHVDELTKEKSLLEKRIEDIGSQLEASQRSCSEAMARAASAETLLRTTEAQFSFELEQTYGVAEINRKLVADMKSFNESLTQKLAKLQQDNAEIVQEYDEKLNEANTSVERRQAEITELKIQNENLQTKLRELEEKTAEILDMAGGSEISKHAPSSVIEVRALKSGRTYAQLWSDLVEQQARNRLLESRVHELDTGLRAVIDEMEESEPAIALLTEERNRLLEAHRKDSRAILDLEKRSKELQHELSKHNAIVAQIEKSRMASESACEKLISYLSHLLSGSSATIVINQLRSMLQHGGKTDANYNDKFDISAKQVESEAPSDYFDEVRELVEKNLDLHEKIDQLADENKALRATLDSKKASAANNTLQETSKHEQSPSAKNDFSSQAANVVEADKANDTEYSLSHSVSGPSFETEVMLLRERIEILKAQIQPLERKLEQSARNLLAKSEEAARLAAQVEIAELEKERLSMKLDSMKETQMHKEARCESHANAARQWSERYDEKLDELRATVAELEATRRQLAAMKLDRDLLEASNKTHMDATGRLASEKEVFRELLMDARELAKRETESMRGELAQARVECEDSRAQIVSLTNRLVALSEQMRTTQHRDSFLKPTIPELQNTSVLSLASVAEATQTHQSPRQANTSHPIISTEAEDMKLKIDELYADIDFLREELAQRDKNMAEITAHAENTERELSQLMKEFNDMVAKCEDVERDLRESRKVINVLEEKYTEDTQKLEAELSRSLETCKQLATSNQMRELQQDQINALVEEIAELRAQYAAVVKAHARDLEDLEKTKKNEFNSRERAQSYALELERTRTVQQEAEAACEAKIRAARESVSGMEEQISKLRKQNEALFRRASMSSNSSEPSPTTMFDQEDNVAAFTLDLEHEQGNNFSEMLQTDDNYISLLRNERNALLAEKEAHTLHYTRTVSKLSATIDDLRRQLETLRATADGSHETALRAELESCMQELTLFRESNATLRREREFAERGHAEAAKELCEVETELRKLRDDRANVFEELALQSKLLAAKTEEAEEWHAKFTEQMQYQGTLTTQKLEELTAELSRVQEELTEKSDLYDELGSRYNILLTRAQDRAKGDKDRIEALLRELKTRDAQVEAQQIESKSLRGQLEEYTAKAKDLEEQIGVLRSELEKRRGELRTVQNQLLQQRLGVPLLPIAVPQLQPQPQLQPPPQAPLQPQPQPQVTEPVPREISNGAQALPNVIRMQEQKPDSTESNDDFSEDPSARVSPQSVLLFAPESEIGVAPGSLETQVTSEHKNNTALENVMPSSQDAAPTPLDQGTSSNDDETTCGSKRQLSEDSTKEDGEYVDFDEESEDLEANKRRRENSDTNILACDSGAEPSISGPPQALGTDTRSTFTFFTATPAIETPAGTAFAFETVVPSVVQKEDTTKKVDEASSAAAEPASH